MIPGCGENPEQGLAFKRGASRIFLDLAQANDGPELAQLNQSVQLDMRLQAQTFLASLSAFGQSGGFFNVMDAAELSACIASERSTIFTLKTKTQGRFLCPGQEPPLVPVSCAQDRGTVPVSCQQRDIIASLWVSLDDPGFMPPSPDLLQALAEYPALGQAWAQGKVCYARELIVARGIPHSISPTRALFYGSFAQLRQAGFTHALAEVYRVTGYRLTDVGGPDSQSHSLDIVNRLALHSVANAAGLVLGDNALRSYSFAQGLEITIQPLIVLFDFARTLEKLQQWMTAQAIDIDSGDQGSAEHV